MTSTNQSHFCKLRRIDFSQSLPAGMSLGAYQALTPILRRSGASSRLTKSRSCAAWLTNAEYFTCPLQYFRSASAKRGGWDKRQSRTAWRRSAWRWPVAGNHRASHREEQENSASEER